MHQDEEFAEGCGRLKSAARWAARPQHGRSTAAAPTYTLEHGRGCRYFTVTFAITRYRIANCGHVFAHWRKNGY